MGVQVENREYFELWFPKAFAGDNYDQLRSRVNEVLKHKPISGSMEFGDGDLSYEDLKLLAMFVSFIEGRDIIPWEKQWGHNPLSFPPAAYYMWATDPELRVAYWRRYDPANDIPELDLARMGWTLKQSGRYWVPMRDSTKPLGKMHVRCFDTEIDLPVGLKAEEVTAYQEVMAKYGHPKMSDCISRVPVSEQRARVVGREVCSDIISADVPS